MSLVVSQRTLLLDPCFSVLFAFLIILAKYTTPPQATKRKGLHGLTVERMQSVTKENGDRVGTGQLRPQKQRLEKARVHLAFSLSPFYLS